MRVSLVQKTVHFDQTSTAWQPWGKVREDWLHFALRILFIIYTRGNARRGRGAAGAAENLVLLGLVLFRRKVRHHSAPYSIIRYTLRYLIFKRLTINLYLLKACWYSIYSVWISWNNPPYSHTNLITKLKSYNISEQIMFWSINFLSHRIQQNSSS